MQIDIGERRPWTFEIRLVFFEDARNREGWGGLVAASPLSAHDLTLICNPLASFLTTHISRLLHQVGPSECLNPFIGSFWKITLHPHSLPRTRCCVCCSWSPPQQVSIRHRSICQSICKPRNVLSEKPMLLTFKRPLLLRDVWLKV